MKHYLVKLNVLVDSGPCVPTMQLIKATHSDKAIEIAKHNAQVHYSMLFTKSCKLVNNCDVSILKAYLD